MDFVLNTDTRWFVELPRASILEMRGKEGSDLLQRISTNDVLTAKDGNWIMTIFTNEKGQMVDVVWVCRFDMDRLLLISRMGNAQGLTEWITKFVIMEEIEITEKEEYCHFVVSGDVVGRSESQIGIQERWKERSLFHIFAESSTKDVVIETLKGQGFVSVYQKDFENYRIASGNPIGIREIQEAANPLEAGLNDYISWTKGCYVGQEVIARLDTYKKVRRRFARFELEERPEHLPMAIYSQRGECGVLTSATEGKQPMFGIGFLANREPLIPDGLYIPKGNARIPLSVKE